jgi:peptide/nickel transport system ATP-binding protein
MAFSVYQPSAPTLGRSSQKGDGDFMGMAHTSQAVQPHAPADEQVLLSIRQLRTYFHSNKGTVRAVDNVSYRVDKGEILAIVGESGSGKSVTALSIMRLVQSPPGFHAGGEILFRGEDLVKKSKTEMRSIRGRDIGMIFQDPMSSLNPAYTIGNQIAEGLRIHEKIGKKDARDRVLEMLELVRIPAAKRRLDEYPFQLSGGLRQRVMIAIALICRPALLIADEPTTALDVTIQAQILQLMVNLRDETGSAVILITHDLGVVAETAERVVVMYAGREMEVAPVNELFGDPAHPYTIGLLNSMPRLDGSSARLTVIPGNIPSLSNLPAGCRFSPRCAFKEKRCLVEEPELDRLSDGRWARCWKPQSRG